MTGRHSVQTLIEEAIDAVQATNAPIVAQASATNSVLTPSFLDYIKSVENGARIGFENGRWYPHKSPEGGLPTIGYGHKLSAPELRQATNGLTNDYVEALLKSDLEKAQKAVHAYIEKRYKVKLKLTPQQEQMLIDYAFNLGGLETFPKFVDAVLRGNKEAMNAQFKRYYTRTVVKKGQKPTTQKVELARNKAFYDKFLAEPSHR